MNIIVTGRHVKVTKSMKDYAKEKASKFSRIWADISKVQITMDVEHDSHCVEAVVDLKTGGNIVAQTSLSDMYAALDAIEDKVEKQLRHLKSKAQDHHPRKRSSQSGASNSEPTYQDIVREELDPN